MKNNICTSLEQSKKLMELGIDVNTADMFWDTLLAKTPEAQVNNHHFVDEYDDEHRAPAWSLSSLMNLLPSELIESNDTNISALYEIKIRKYNLIEDVDLYQIAYGNYKIHEDGNSSWKDMVNTGEKENLIDAAFEMIVWLKENGKL